MGPLPHLKDSPSLTKKQPQPLGQEDLAPQLSRSQPFGYKPVGLLTGTGQQEALQQPQLPQDHHDLRLGPHVQGLNPDCVLQVPASCGGCDKGPVVLY